MACYLTVGLHFDPIGLEAWLLLEGIHLRCQEASPGKPGPLQPSHGVTSMVDCRNHARYAQAHGKIDYMPLLVHGEERPCADIDIFGKGLLCEA